MAEALRQDMHQTSNAAPGETEYLSFGLGGNEYSVDIMSVREIRGWTRTTSLPHSPPYVRGVINLRGAVLPVIDLAVRLGLPAAEPEDRNVIIVVDETITDPEVFEDYKRAVLPTIARFGGRFLSNDR